MSDQPPDAAPNRWEMSITAEADVTHGDPDRCTDECRERCAAEREKRTP